MFGNRLTRTRFDIFKKMNSEQHLEDIFLTYLKVISVYFRSRNFRKFREFWPFSRKFKTRKSLFWPIRESLCSQNFYKFSHFLNLFFLFFLDQLFPPKCGIACFITIWQQIKAATLSKTNGKLQVLPMQFVFDWITYHQLILSMKWILCCSPLLHLPIKINLWRFQELLFRKFKWDILTPPKIIQMKMIRNGKILNKKEEPLIYLMSDLII